MYVTVRMNVELYCVSFGATGWWLLAGDSRISAEGWAEASESWSSISIGIGSWWSCLVCNKVASVEVVVVGSVYCNTVGWPEIAWSNKLVSCCWGSYYNCDKNFWKALGWLVVALASLWLVVTLQYWCRGRSGQSHRSGCCLFTFWI